MLTRIKNFPTSAAFLPIPLLIGIGGLFGDEKTKIISMIVNAFVLAFVLFVSDDLLPALLPAFCIIVIGATLLSTLTMVIPYIPYAYPVAIGFLFHIIRYRRPITVGASFFGLLITSVAVLVSGIGTSPASRDYSSLGAVYHLIGLSVGLILLYLLFASNRREDRAFDPIHYFLMSLMLLGLLCSAVVFDNFLEWFIPYLTETGTEAEVSPKAYFKEIPYRNTISTLAVMCLPSAFYMAKQSRRGVLHIFFFLIGLIIYLGAILTLARTAILFGSLLLLICVVYYLWGRGFAAAKIFNLLLLVGGAAAAIMVLDEALISLLDFRLPKGWISSDESRIQLLLRSFKDFKNHPLFGIGITSTANSDIYSAEGCICWYHLYFPQIWGSMGGFGLLAYAVQWMLRAKLVFTKPDTQSIAMGLVYLGLFLYSQTDPGEFAPIPYAVLTVPLFMLLEGRAATKKAEKTSCKKAPQSLSDHTV